MARISINLFFLFISLSAFSQIKKEPLYLYLDNRHTISVFEGYKLYMNIESKDTDFSHDTFFFVVWKKNPFEENTSLYEAGKSINLDTVNYKTVADFGKDWVQIH